MEAIIDSAVELIATAIMLYLTPALTRALVAARDRMRANAAWAKVDRDGKLLATFEKAILTAVTNTYGRGLTVEEALRQGEAYVRRSVPEAIEELGASGSIIKDKLTAELIRLGVKI